MCISFGESKGHSVSEVGLISVLRSLSHGKFSGYVKFSFVFNEVVGSMLTVLG